MNPNEPIMVWVMAIEAHEAEIKLTWEIVNRARQPAKEVAAARRRIVEEKIQSPRYVFTTLTLLRDRIPAEHLPAFDRLLYDLHRLHI